MIRILVCILTVFSLSLPVSALEIEAPIAPSSAADIMPDNSESFPSALLELLRKVLAQLSPSYREALDVIINIIASVIVLGMLHTLSDKTKAITDIVGCCTISYTLFFSAESMIQLAASTIQELSNYGKLLLPVMTTAMAAQGGISSSAALYAGTAFFDSVISSILSNLLMPMVYLFLVLSIANSALGEDTLRNLCNLVKCVVIWSLKTILTVFTTYLSITGVISGTTDTSTLKATKVAISSAVPIVGGILSDSSEAILVSAGLMKNAAGIYGILAILAIFLSPFLRIGINYLLIKAASAICGIFASKRIVGLIDDFAAAMGILLAMTGSICVLFLVSTICYMRGMN